MAAQHDVDLLRVRLALRQQHLALVKEQQLPLPQNLQLACLSEAWPTSEFPRYGMQSMQRTPENFDN